MTNQAFKQLLEDQMVAFANHLSKQFTDLDRDQVVTKAREHCSGLNLLDTVSKKRYPLTKSPRDPAYRCMARVWQSGSGLDQCTRARIEGQDYCKSHAKKAAFGVAACQVATEGKGLATVPAKLRIGLWCGRIDEWQDGEEGIPPYKDGEAIIRIEWSNETIKARIAVELEEGTARHVGERRPRSLKSKTPTPVDSSLVDELTKRTVDDTSVQLIDALESETKIENIDSIYDADTDVEDNCEPKYNGETNGEDICKPKSNGEMDGEEDMEVEEWEYNGETYYVDSNNGDIYNIVESIVIGKWEGDSETGTPILN